MGTRVEAAHSMMAQAALLKDSGARNDVEAGLAKLIACFQGGTARAGVGISLDHGKILLRARHRMG